MPYYIFKHSSQMPLDIASKQKQKKKSLDKSVPICQTMFLIKGEKLVITQTEKDRKG